MSTTTITACKHRDQYGEGVELPTDVSLEHFDQCFTAERRLEMWGLLRERSDRATRCLIADHDGALVELHWCHERLIELADQLLTRPGRTARWSEYHRRQKRRNR